MSTRVLDNRYSRYVERNMQLVKEVDALPSWLPMAVEPAYWLAADSGT